MKTAYKALIVAIFGSNIAIAGGIGGGNPPAKELQMELLSQSPGEAALFLDTDAVVRLGVNGALDPTMILSTMETRKKIVKVPESHIEAILDASSTAPVTIEAVNLQGEVKAYDVEQGKEPGSVILIEQPQ